MAASKAGGAVSAAHSAAYDLRRPPAARVPLVVNSPHSGRDYPAAFLRAARLDGAGLRRSEDCFVDEIFADAPGEGAPLLAARFPRAYVDVNREPYELDPAMFADALPPHVNTRSPRAAEGLGTIARVAGGRREIYRDRLVFAEAEARIRELYMPYHAQLRALVMEAKAAFGAVVLLDCHSMPSRHGPGGDEESDIVLGNCFGSSAAAALSAAAEEILAGLGFRVALNRPYAGGFITAHYGRPQTGVHALQIELARRLYMNEARLRRHAGLRGLRQKMRAFMRRFGRRAADIFSSASKAPL